MKKIYLTGKRSKGQFAMVDDDDFEKCVLKSWYMTPLGRAKSMHKMGSAWKQVFMHRFIMGFPDGFVDHINRNPLDNRKANLRVCSNAENMANSPPKSGRRFKGIRPNGSRWEARIKKNGKDIYIGYFLDEVSAARAYNQKAKELFGEFAWLNPI